MKLYKLDKRGRIREWEINSEDETIIINHGIQGCQKTEEIIDVYDSVGELPISFKVEQIVQARISRKKDGGYVNDINMVSSQPTNQLGFYRPMLAVDVKEEKVDYGSCYVQRKYNGHRCLVTRTQNGLVAYSRGGKLITSIEHVLDGLRVPVGATLDGELYVHGWSLQKISSSVRKKEEQDPCLKYVVYDLIDIEKPFRERMKLAKNMVVGSSGAKFAGTHSVTTLGEIKKLFLWFLKQKYEGAIIRHGENGYLIGNRSINLMRMKPIEDEEFTVVDIVTSKDGWGILICETKEGKRFRASAPGTHAEKFQILKKKKQFIGEKIIVEFAYYSDKDIPVQPVAKQWLKDISI